MSSSTRENVTITFCEYNNTYNITEPTKDDDPNCKKRTQLVKPIRISSYQVDVNGLYLSINNKDIENCIKDNNCPVELISNLRKAIYDGVIILLFRYL